MDRAPHASDACETVRKLELLVPGPCFRTKTIMGTEIHGSNWRCSKSHLLFLSIDLGASIPNSTNTDLPPPVKGILHGVSMSMSCLKGRPKPCDDQVQLCPRLENPGPDAAYVDRCLRQIRSRIGSRIGRLSNWLSNCAGSG